MPMPLEKLGPYEVRDLIGRGGMGAVYLGLEQRSRKQVAIKVLSPLLGNDESFRERFEAEILSLEKLRHPNIVELYGYGEENGHLFFAMELVAGKSLEEEIAKGRSFGWREVVRIAVDVCGALKHAHDHGIIHRDIKPANLLLSHNNQVKLTDFGIAKLFGNSQMTAIGGVVGTADYMAPEQAEGLPATARCDLYSLGGVMFALLAGRAPFKGKSLPEVVHKVRYEPALPVRRLAPDTPEALEQIIDQLLSKDSNRRVPTALALSKRLLAIQHALTVNPPEQEQRIPEIKQSSHTGLTTIEGVNDEDDEDADFAHDETAFMPMGADESAESALPPVLEISDHASVTGVADPNAPRAAGASNGTTYTVVDEASRRRARDDNVPTEVWWVRAAKLGGLLFGMASLGAVGWIVSRPMSVEALYYKISEAAAAESPQMLLDAETYLDEFVERFPDDARTSEVHALKESVDTEKLARRLELRARKQTISRRLNPMEEILLEAMRMEFSQPEQAAMRLQGLVDSFSEPALEDENVRRIVELARSRLLALQGRMAESNQRHADLVSPRLDEAEALMATDPQAAGRILRGLILLYGDKPWAKELMVQARELLDKHQP